MKLDYDFLREILLVLEDITDGHKNYTKQNICDYFPSVDRVKTLYHLKYLDDVGFTDGGNGFILDITPTGRNYLNAVRNDTVWESTKEIIQKWGSSVALSVISSVADSLVRKSLIP